MHTCSSHPRRRTNTPARYPTPVQLVTKTIIIGTHSINGVCAWLFS